MIQYYRQLLISFKKIEIQFKTKDVENDRMKYISWEESLKVLQLKKNPKNTNWRMKAKNTLVQDSYSNLYEENIINQHDKNINWELRFI